MKLRQISEGILSESGLSRILTHINKPFAIITAFRANYTLDQNRKRNRELEKRFKEIGAGGLKIIGHWREAPEGIWFGHNFNDIDQNQLIDTTEEAYFVPKPNNIDVATFREWVLKIITEFQQDAAVYSSGNAIFLIDKANTLTNIGTGISVGKIAQAYSTIKKKNFVFEGTMSPSNIYHKMLLKERGVFWV